MENLTADQRRQMNDNYRQGAEPREPFVRAFLQAVATGEVARDLREEMLDLLFDPWPDSKKDTPVDPFEPSAIEKRQGREGNGLASAIVRHDYYLRLHVSKKLYWMQPIGVLLRPISDEVRRAGEALITTVDVRSADVEAEIMPAEHYALRIEPTPLWLAKYVGEHGYPTR